MGLDSVELLVTVEEAFGVSFTDPEAEKMGTVGDLYEGVWNKIKDREQIENDKCKSAVLFYKFRNHFETEFSTDRKKVLPNSLLEGIIPKEDIKTVWSDMRKGLDLKIPPLVYPKTVSYALSTYGLITIVGGLVAALIAINYFDLSYVWWLVPIIGSFSTIGLDKLAQPLKTALPVNDIRALVENAVMLNYGKMSDSYGTSKQETESVIKLIIQDRIGVELEEIVPEASFTHDLGID